MSIVSVFKNVSKADEPAHYDIVQHLEDIRDGKWQDDIIFLRNIPEKAARDEFKRTLPTTSFSGKFAYRNDGSLEEHSGFIGIDIDGLEIEEVERLKEQLIQDRYVYSVFVSPSGNGLRIIMKIDGSKHRETFLGIAQYFIETYDQPIDQNGINVSKPYVVSFDPFLYLDYADKKSVFKKTIKEREIKKSIEYVYTPGDFKEIVEEIISKNIDICSNYEEWRKAGFAISDQFGEDGRGYFHKISEVSGKYNFRLCDKQYTAFIKAGKSGISINSFYYLAKEKGVKIYSEQTKLIIKITKNGKKAGLSKEQIVENLDKFEGLKNTDKLVSKIFNSNVDYSDSSEDNVLEQLEMFLTNGYPDLVKNEVTGYFEQNGRMLTPEDVNSIFIAAKKLISKLDYQLMMRLLKSNFIKSYNPFFEFFGSNGLRVELPPDPQDNSAFTSPLIDKLSATIVNDNPAYTAFFVRKWIVGVVAGVHGIHNPLLLCLLGRQNSGKTEFFRRITPNELKQYNQDSKLDKGKDDEILMTECMIIVDDELGGKSKQDVQKLKEITSKQFFSLRRPYGEHNERILRIASLGGTSNFKQIMSDPTGNRRIIPIDVDDIDKKLYNSINKKEMWLEAFELYKNGFDWRIGKNDMDFLNKDLDDYEHTVKERELLLKYFEIGTEHTLSTTEMIVELDRITGQKLSTVILGRELNALGFTKKSERLSPVKTVKKWCVNRINRPNMISTAPYTPDF